MLRTWSWAVLALLLAATLAGAAALDRRSWPELMGDEATYLMQAQSLAWDFDLRYSRADYDRFVAQWGKKPDGLILQSGEGGSALLYSKPISYSLYIAPFVRLSPVRGAGIANALLLALAGIVAARTLSRRIGPAAPLWVAAFLFASVTFAYVFWVHSDLFLLCLVALAFSLAYGVLPEETETRGRAVLRWAAVGVLLGLVVMSRPFYAPLLLPAFLAVPARDRKVGIAALAASAGAVALSATLFNLVERESWSSYSSAQRRSFYSYTGFPEVDLPPDGFQKELAARGTHSWTFRVNSDGKQAAWNSLYFLAGRHTGLLPYFLPVALGFLVFRRGEGRWALVFAVAVSMALFLAMRPFNFYGGGGAIADRYFLPLYPALWFLAARPSRAAWPLLAAALAAPFLLPLWTAPRAFPIDPAGGYRYVSDFARRWLPYETTQSHLKPAGREDLVHNALWVKLLSNTLRPEEDGARLVLAAGREGQILLGSPTPLEGVQLEMTAPLEVDGTAVTEKVFPVRFSSPRAVHRMWWTDGAPWYLYQVRLESKGGEEVSFRIRTP
ncbi:MAG TPA: hypothetical protein VLQ45_08635 [Thermoanaerobaculia bacterium]|nr:hypothetical protein [Thermoanaerobaculia bacterium]